MRAVRHVACAISGGVDSAVAALLLKRKGFNVTGVFMQNWDQTNEFGRCTADVDREDAEYVCQHLGIPFVYTNFVKQYWNNVFSTLVQGYEEGTTPNPDVLCNRHIKFGALFNHVTSTLGMDALATGHYACHSYGNLHQYADETKDARLLIPRDIKKDQTLFLCQIQQNALRRTMFPVGDLLKDTVKEIALSAGLKRIVEKKESMGICFIGSRNFQDFIKEYIEPRPGHFIDIETGKVVGHHKGTHHWTVGQRSQLGGWRKAYFVADVDPATQDIFVASGTDHPALFTDSLFTRQPHWICSVPAEFKQEGVLECQFRFQHAHPLIKCTVRVCDGDQLEVLLERPLRAITPGQYAVFYRNDECLGSAYIVRPGPSRYEQNRLERIQTDNRFS